ncbi:hypothetical protein HY496_01430 [Candidatus Woesearchaeota archaeon]|nr:hypothetical protein [Candidatus Woesearchaeota archaeon]
MILLRRGQMEMIGLVVIVLLVTIAFLFLVQFALNDRSDPHFFARKQLATSTLMALSITTTSDCVSGDGPQIVSVNELLKDCAVNREGGFGYNCKGKYSCAYLREELIPTLMAGSLDTFRQRYELRSILIQDPDPPLLRQVGNDGCAARTNVDTSGEFPLDTGAGLVMSTLLICD